MVVREAELPSATSASGGAPDLATHARRAAKLASAVGVELLSAESARFAELRQADGVSEPHPAKRMSLTR